ncbi:MAG TPA: hypothetical protein DCY89_05660 [Gammaproteobacteria bacterium]|nr:hypothetical protein [Gammaproteobacteria bacterium]
MAGIRREAQIANMSVDECLQFAMAAGWQTFRAEWAANAINGKSGRASGAALLDKNGTAIDEAIRAHRAEKLTIKGIST